MIDGVPPEDAATIAKDPRFKLYSGASDRIVMLAMDSSRDVSPFITDLNGNKLTSNPLKDVRVRRAMSLSIDRDAIRDRVMDGHSIPNNQLIPKGLGGYATSIPEAKVDLPTARALMKEAGWEKGFAIALACPEGRYVNASKICQAAAQMLGRIGIKVTVEVMPYGVFASRVTNKTGDRASLMLFAWGASSSGEANVLQNAIHTWDKERRLGAWNIGMYSNPEVDALIQKGLDTLDATERHAIQAQAMAKAMEDVAAIPLHTQVVLVATRKGLKYTVQANECTLADFVETISD
jgi:peptide/nickel transport system substrate-binding protein